MRSPGFSKFRELMDTWDDYLAEEDRTNQIRSLVDNPSFVLFFRKGNEIFGAPEDSRVIFARMKSKNDEDGEKWKKEADFIAVNLSSCVRGETSKTLINRKDLGKVKVIDKDKAYESLLDIPCGESKPAQVISIVSQSEDRR